MNQLNKKNRLTPKIHKSQDAGPSYTGLSDDVNNDYYNETDYELTDPLPKLSSERNYLFLTRSYLYTNRQHYL